jgi:hypothetical protein
MQIERFVIPGAVALLASLTSAFASTSVGPVIEKTAEPFFRKGPVYIWELSLSVSADNVDIRQGESGTIKNEFGLKRVLANVEGAFGVRGRICVRNYGKSEIRRINIVDVVEEQRNSQWFPLESTRQTVAKGISLDQGERRCFHYETLLPLGTDRKSILRNVATAKNAEDIVPFDLNNPKQEMGVIDYSLNVQTNLECPDGFSCLGKPPGPNFTTSGNASFNWETIVTNVSVPCGQTREVKETFATETSDLHSKSSILIGINFTTGTCTSGPMKRIPVPYEKKIDVVVGK